MGLDNPDTIDLTTKSLPGDECRLGLYVVETDVTRDEAKRYEMLVRKLGTYAEFVVSEEFAREFPGITPADVLIRVLCASQPGEAMRQIATVHPRGREEQSIPVTCELTAEFERRHRLGEREM